ncbi:hypothetical protein [Sulfuriflexus mobilis]|uniref:hypothetical protein n=1 Tax=Sulfuriflexus mobilis TaxID=1811807 RepID=UPI000F84C313|nr:hypothetical protein [Sulfuriflexus mobilis]
MNSNWKSIEEKEWGHKSDTIEVAELIEEFRKHVLDGIQEYKILPDGPEPYTGDKCKGFERVSVTIPVSERFYDQFFNGKGGYRAQYYLWIENGESFNRALVEAVAPLIINAEQLYNDKFARELCEKSLLGKYSKFWFSKDITDPSAEEYLNRMKEGITVKRWLEYWKNKQQPRKGILLINPESKVILLNGTFVNMNTDEECEQKPFRSKELYEKGWT